MADNYKFEPENVARDMVTLEGHFTSFAETLKELNDYIATIINAGADSAILGSYGAKLFEIWDANASTFGDFHANFSAWSEAVAVISANNSNFEVNTIAAYLNDGTEIDSFVAKGSTLDGVSDARAFVKEHGRDGDTSSLSDDVKAVMANSSDTKVATTRVDGNFLITTTYDENGNKVETKTNLDGEVVSEITYFEDGTKRVTSYSSSGGYNVSEYYDTGDRSSFTVYDANGNIAELYRYNPEGTEPKLFYKIIYNEDGYVITSNYSNGNVTTSQYDLDDNLVSSSVEVKTAEGFMDTYGYADGSSAWQDAFKSLPVEQQAIVLENSGTYNKDAYAINDYHISNTIPENGEYDGRNIIAPKLTESDFSALNRDGQNNLRNSNAQVIIDSAFAVKENLDGEITGLQTLKTNLSTNESFSNLPSDTQTAIKSYLDTQISNRQTLSNDINSECSTGFFDGTIADAATYWYNVESGNNVSDVDRFNDYNEAYQTAMGWQEKLNGIENLNAVTAYLNSYGVF